MQFRVVVAAGRTLFRQGLRALAEADARYAVAGEAGDRDEARRITHREQPDVVLLDSELVSLEDGCALIACLRAECPRAAIIVIGEADRTALSEEEAEEALREERSRALKAGACAYLPARADSGELMRLLGAVVATRCEEGDPAAPSAETLSRTLVAANSAARHRITERERAIVALIAQGLCNKEVAHRLGIGTQTVKNHVSHLLEKLALADRTQLAVYAVEHRYDL